MHWMGEAINDKLTCTLDRNEARNVDAYQNGWKSAIDRHGGYEIEE